MAVIKQHPPTRGFADSTFNSLITFFLINDAGCAHARYAGRSLRNSRRLEQRSGGEENILFRRADPPDCATAHCSGRLILDGRCSRRFNDGRHAAMAEATAAPSTPEC